MPAISTFGLRISTAKKYKESLSIGLDDTSPERNILYFFIGKPVNEDVLGGNSRHYTMEYYPYEYTKIIPTGTENYNSVIRVEHSTDNTQFQALVDPELSCYGHLYITNITQGSFPDSGETLRLIFDDDGTEIVSNRLIKFKRAFPISTQRGIVNFASATDFDQRTAHNEMISLKRVKSDDTRLSIKRKNWISGNNYYPWSGIAGSTYVGSGNTTTRYNICGSNMSNLEDVDYYVMNDIYEVFMCIRSKSTASTDKPSSRDNTKYNFNNKIFTGDDGYMWRHMFTITEQEDFHFLTGTHIPIPTDLSPWEGYPYKSPVMAYSHSGDFNINTTGTVYTIAFDPSSGTENLVTLKMVANASNTVTNDNLTVHTTTGQEFNFISTMLSHYGFVDENELSSTTTGNIVPLYGATDEIPDIEVIVPPIGGYGADVVSQLMANTLSVNIFLEHNIDDIRLTNFSQIGLIENVLQNNGIRAVADALSANSAFLAENLDPVLPIGSKMSFNSNQLGAYSTSALSTNKNELDSGELTTYRFIQPYKYCTEGKESVVDSGDSFKLFPRTYEFIDSFSTALTGISPYSRTDSFTLGSGNVSLEGMDFNADGLSEREIMPYSGNIIYISERETIRRQTNRTEKITLTMSF